jgi:hypothetical protein
MHLHVARQPCFLHFVSQTHTHGCVLSNHAQVQQQTHPRMGCPGRPRSSSAGGACALFVPAFARSLCHQVIISHEQGIKILECTQTSGDILYVPSMYALSHRCGFVSHEVRKVGAFGVVLEQHHRHSQVVFILIMQLRSACGKSSSFA